MRSLLDVNVLIALLDGAHIHQQFHARAFKFVEHRLRRRLFVTDRVQAFFLRRCVRHWSCLGFAPLSRA
mgnify:CR=1 FL=1